MNIQLMAVYHAVFNLAVCFLCLIIGFISQIYLTDFLDKKYGNDAIRNYMLSTAIQFVFFAISILTWSYINKL